RGRRGGDPPARRAAGHRHARAAGMRSRRPAGGAAIRTGAAPPAEVRDTVGAGDTFAGGFAAEWLASGHAARAARLAVAAASLKVGRAGTYSALPTADEIRRLRHALDQDEDKDT